MCNSLIAISDGVAFDVFSLKTKAFLNTHTTKQKTTHNLRQHQRKSILGVGNYNSTHGSSQFKPSTLSLLNWLQYVHSLVLLLLNCYFSCAVNAVSLFVPQNCVMASGCAKLFSAFFDFNFMCMIVICITIFLHHKRCFFVAALHVMALNLQNLGSPHQGGCHPAPQRHGARTPPEVLIQWGIWWCIANAMPWWMRQEHRIKIITLI